MNFESPTPERFTSIRAKLEKLARWGVMASALSGILPAELAAQENLPQTTSIEERTEKLDTAQTLGEIERRTGTENAESLKLHTPSRSAFPVRENANAVPIEGFEQRPAEVAASVRAAFDFLPAHLVAHIARVRYDSRKMNLAPAYGMSEGVEAAHADIVGREIVLSAGSDTAGPFMLFDTVAHELCHEVDPKVDGQLSRRDRVNAYKRVLDRVEAPDRFHSWYVESIKNPDPHLQLTIKATEYWAETCGAYLRNPALLPDADRALVRSVVQALEPGYNEAEAYQRVMTTNDTLGALSDSWAKQHKGTKAKQASAKKHPRT